MEYDDIGELAASVNKTKQKKTSQQSAKRSFLFIMLKI